MSLEQSRFTIMALPQGVDNNGVLSLNIVFIPRNINPLVQVNTCYNAANKAKAFVEVRPQFDIKIANNPDEFPGKIPADEKTLGASFSYSGIMGDIYKTLRDAVDAQGHKKYFDIDEARSTDKVPSGSEHRATKAEANRDSAIRKYLPVSYRKAFNFTSPRVKNAVTDDSYYCAMRDQKPKLDFVKDDKVSWGKVYAHLMRQPLMAKKAGLIYETKVQLAATDFEKGGWLYVDIKKDTDYYAEQQRSLDPSDPHYADGPFFKRYAARIPALKKNEARSLFAALLFPVMNAGDSPEGIWDELFLEAARYNEGFATIVHANQPVSGNLLQEEQDGFHPQKEVGIRLGWEDEQILIWYLRQMAVDENTGKRLDAPLGINGYHVDVKKSTAGDDAWESLTAVLSNGNMFLEGIDIGSYTGELPYQVYPVKIYDGIADANNYWLPMYFANWNNSSLVLPDKTAAQIYQSEKALVREKTGVDKYEYKDGKSVKISDTYKAPDMNTKLVYGNEYHFRVRMSDISGGCPSPGIPTLPDFSVSHVGKTHFKRYVAPHEVTIHNRNEIRINTDDHNFSGSSLKLSRPLLNYPAVVYTGKYAYPGVIDKLVTSVDASKEKGKAYGIPDPDVKSVEIKVEVETLRMDNLASDDGRENYITLYKTTRLFKAFNEDDPEGAIDIPIRFIDVNVLKLTDMTGPFPRAADNDFITKTSGEIILPTARNIRLTLRAVGDEYPGNPDYWGHVNTINSNLDSRYGKTTVLSMRKESANEQNIFTGESDPQTLQGIYLQPDPVKLKLDPVVFKALQGGNEGMSDIVHRLGGQLDVAVKGLTLVSENGERLQFWCSNMIRHSMAPDNSSITFANRNELQGHWLVCTTLIIDRDWTWDSPDASSFEISRKRRRGHDHVLIGDKDWAVIGDLELKKTASFQAIQKSRDGMIHREYTKIIFIDVADNEPPSKPSSIIEVLGHVDPKYLPDTVELQYRIKPKFRAGHTPVQDAPLETLPILLPATSNPSQTPRLIAAGIALSPYYRNEKYSATEPRTRFLWLEFDKKPRDEHDDLFCRVLAYSPDQLISNNHPSLMELPEEPALPLDPEYIRVVTPGSSHDHSGLNAMQKMEKATDGDRHYYLLPLPAGLHHESPELFGMFTYEFRYGHSDRIWSTAQGRFGRALRVAGLQHPAPVLACMVNRDEKMISVTATYAKAVFNGRNVTASPPRTSLWALLYAQVKQADGLDYRNILLNEKELKHISKRSMKNREINIRRSLEDQNAALKKKNLPLFEITDELIHKHIFQQIALEKEGNKQASGRWGNKEVNDMLDLYGLPHDSPLSVLCVEVYGQITNIFEHIDDFGEEKMKTEFLDNTALTFGHEVAGQMTKNIYKAQVPGEKASADPLNSQLGLFRILRTSPLTEVPFICIKE